MYQKTEILFIAGTERIYTDFQEKLAEMTKIMELEGDFLCQRAEGSETQAMQEIPDWLVVCVESAEDEIFGHFRYTTEGFLTILVDGAKISEGDLQSIQKETSSFVIGTNQLTDKIIMGNLLRAFENWRANTRSQQEKFKTEKAYHDMASAVAASPIAFLSINKDRYVTFFSQHYHRMFPRIVSYLQPGIHASEAYLLIAREMGMEKTDPRYIELQQWWDNPTGHLEFRDNNGKWLRMQARFIPDSQDIVVSTMNISDYKQQQYLLVERTAALSLSLEKEQQTVEQQRLFVSMVSHEFRTPLTVIDGNAQIIQKRGAELEAEALQKRATTIRSSVERLIYLMTQILSSDLSEVGQLTIHPERCDLSEIIMDVCKEEKEIAPDCDLQCQMKDLPETVILDPGVIHHVVSNLVGNAIKYSKNDPRIIVHAQTKGTDIIVTVQDHGVGIPESEIPKVFERFYRASTSSGIPGTGIGLNLVKTFIELHGGEINIESKEGEGTLARLVLPIKNE